MPDTMAELGKLPKEVLVYSGPTHCNNNPTVNYVLKEKRLTVDSALEKRALDNCCYGQTCLLVLKRKLSTGRKRTLIVVGTILAHSSVVRSSGKRRRLLYYKRERVTV